MNRCHLLGRLDKAWKDFQESYAGLSDSQLLAPGATGAWSVRDIVAHVTTWEQEALKHLPLILKGERPPRYSVMYGGIDPFHARTTEEKKRLSLHEVLRQMTDIHGGLIDFIKAVPEDQFQGETRFRHRLRLDTYSHYSRHARAIRKWLGERLVTIGMTQGDQVKHRQYSQFALLAMANKKDSGYRHIRTAVRELLSAQLDLNNDATDVARLTVLDRVRDALAKLRGINEIPL